MVAFLLLMALAGAPQAGGPVFRNASTAFPPSGQMPTHVDAAALAREGQYDAALAAFRRIAAVDPRDHEARVWIGRLHVLMGDTELAEPVYRSVLLEDPSNFDAMLGLGTTLVALGRTEEGLDLLERAETLQPQHPELLDALGRAYRVSGLTTRALLYAERAVDILETDASRRALEQTRMIHDHRVELASFGERYNTTAPDTRNVDLRVNVRVREQFRIVGRAQHQRKFGFAEQRGGGGLEWHWRPQTRVFAQVLAGPRSNDVLARVDVAGEVTHTEGSADWSAGYRFFEFPSARVSVISPGVVWWPRERTSLAAHYYFSLTDFPTIDSREEGHSLSLQASHRIASRLWTLAGYTAGTNDFDTLSPDQTGDFRANAISGGLRLDLPSLTSLIGTYDHQWRQNDIRMHRLSISLQQRF
jgi:YaiO family outer membrane protein